MDACISLQFAFGIFKSKTGVYMPGAFSVKMNVLW